MTTTTPDAVEAVQNVMDAYSPSEWLELKEHAMPQNIVDRLSAQGFTIARAAPAMSEAELERELEGRSYPAPGDIRLLTVNDAREIAKKYRGYDE